MSSDLVWAMVRMLVTLPIVLGLVYLVLKYGLARRYVTASGQRRMKLVEQLPLGPKSTLSLVAMGGVYYLLAHQENSITLVKELGELPEPDEIKIADIVELTPQPIKDYDLKKPPESGIGEKKAPNAPVEMISSTLQKLAGQASNIKKSVVVKMTGRTVNDDKDGKKIEG